MHGRAAHQKAGAHWILATYRARKAFAYAGKPTQRHQNLRLGKWESCNDARILHRGARYYALVRGMYTAVQGYCATAQEYRARVHGHCLVALGRCAVVP